MRKMCLVHKDAPATVMCHQCHKPICKKCVIVTGTGSFCSSECVGSNRTFHERMQKSAPGRRFAIPSLLTIIVVLVVAFFAAVYFTEAMPSLDVIGKLIKAFKGR